MLILARKRGERIMVGPDVVITICETGANVVRVGVDAPREMPVLREELLTPERRELEM